MKLSADRRKLVGGESKRNFAKAESPRLCYFPAGYPAVSVGAKPKGRLPAAGCRDMRSRRSSPMALILIGSLTFILCMNSNAKSATSQPTKDLIANHNGTIAIESHGSVLKEILDRLRQDYAIEIKGLEHKKDTPVTFSHTSDSLEGLLKGLLRHLGEKNYAFEFIDQKLKRISVFPGVQNAKVSQTTKDRATTSEQRFVTAAEVQDVIEGSQAEALGIIPGDIIVAYDGVKVYNALQLVKEVEKKSSLSNIEMVAIRDNSPMRFTLTGGLIGVRIQTKQIPSEDYEKFNPDNSK